MLTQTVNINVCEYIGVNLYSWISVGEAISHALK
jgi:hypothetical protein